MELMAPQAPAPTEGRPCSQQGQGTWDVGGSLLRNGFQLHGDESVKSIAIGDPSKIKAVFYQDASCLAERFFASKKCIGWGVSIKNIEITFEFGSSAIA